MVLMFYSDVYLCSSHFLPQRRYIIHSLGLSVSPPMDSIFQMQVIGGHWIAAVFRMITMGLEGESVGSMFGLYGVCCIPGRLDHKRSVDVYSFVV